MYILYIYFTYIYIYIYDQVFNISNTFNIQYFLNIFNTLLLLLLFSHDITLASCFKPAFVLFCWFVFFFIYFVCNSFLCYLLLFLLKHFVVVKDSISQVLTSKKISFKCLRGQRTLGTQFTTSRTALWFTCIFMLNQKQLLNKTGAQNFLKKCLFTLRMIIVFENI